MILHQLRTRGIGIPFRDREVVIDFAALGAGIHAFVGGNGAGKTTLMELAGPATLFGELASYRESFTEHVCPGVRDAFSELTFEVGERGFRALRQADPLFNGGRGKQEAYLFEGERPIAGPLVKDFAEQILKIVGPKEAWYASVFHAQGGHGSFSSLRKAERKDLFAALLNLEECQRKSEAAHKRAGESMRALETIRKSLADARGRAERAAVLKRERIELLAELVGAQRALDEASAVRRRHAQDYAGWRERLAEIRASAGRVEEQRARLQGEVAALESKISATEAEIEKYRELVAQKPAAAHAKAELSRMDAEMKSLWAEEVRAAKTVEPLQREEAELRASLGKLREDWARVASELNEAQEAKKRLAALGPADEPDLLGAQGVAEAEIRKGEEKVLELEGAAADEARLASRESTLLKEISLAEESAAGVCDRCPLTATLRRHKQELRAVQAELVLAAAAAAALRRVREDLAGRRREAAVLAAKIARANELRAKHARDVVAAEEIPGLEGKLEELRPQGTKLKARLAEVESALGTERAQLANLRALRAELESAGQQHGELAAMLPEIEKAEIHLANHREDLANEKKRLSDTAAELAKLPEPADTEAAANLAEEFAQALQEAERVEAEAAATLRRLDERRARLEGEEAALGDHEKEIFRLEREEYGLCEEISDFELLERALGRDGVQALEIDAAGPTVASIANELLVACYGPRFQIALETLAEKKSKANEQKEVFDLRIIDAEAGREAKQVSGGESIIVGEALRQALAIFNVQRSAIPLRTLYRDETVGALSPENADRYIAMLRRAMEIGGFHQCLLVAHQPEVWSQCDTRLAVSEGVIEVV